MTSLAFLAGCTKYVTYKSNTLSMLPLEAPLVAGISSKTKSDVIVAWKFFDREECQTYLGRNLLAEGYIPIQLTIHNNSNDPMGFSLDYFNIPIFDPDKVATSLHVSADDRVRRWRDGGTVHIFPPIMIPAMIDGFKTLHANEKLDKDYAEKSLKGQIIEPRSSFNGVIFTDQEHINQSIEMFLINTTTQEKVVFSDIAFSQELIAELEKQNPRVIR